MLLFFFTCGVLRYKIVRGFFVSTHFAQEEYFAQEELKCASKETL